MDNCRKMNYKYCMAPMCTNTTVTTPKKIFFMVPNIGEIRKQWCLAMKRDTVKNPALTSNSALYCCEDHFNLEEDTENFLQYRVLSLQKGKKVGLQLKKGALPHIFRNQPASETPQYDTKKRKFITSEEKPSANIVIKSIKVEPNVCRTCFSFNHPLVSFQEKVKPYQNLTVAEMLVKMNCLKIPDNKTVPKKICTNCYSKMAAAYEFQLHCHRMEELWEKSIVEEKQKHVTLKLTPTPTLQPSKINSEHNNLNNVSRSEVYIKTELVEEPEKNFVSESEKQFLSENNCGVDLQDFQIKQEIKCEPFEDDFETTEGQNVKSVMAN